MEAAAKFRKRFVRNRAGTYLMVLLLVGTTDSAARDEWFRSLDLEPGLGEASLVLAGRVVEVSETRIMMGGKVETPLLQFTFAPMVVLKGVFSRDSLTLTSQDLGSQFSTDAPIEQGQVRLLMLGRSNRGYTNIQPDSGLQQSVPQLSGQDDQLIEAVRILLAVNAAPERPSKIALLLAGLRGRRGAAIIPLLASLERRALLAAQTPGVVEAVSRHLSDPSPSVREQAAKALYALLESDYLDQAALRDGAASALVASLQSPDTNVAARVAALRALGAAGPGALGNPSASAFLRTDAATTFAEQGARLHAMGQLRISGQQAAVLAVLKQVPLDAPQSIQSSAEWALGRLDPADGVKEVDDRLKRKYGAGFPVVTEINSLGDLPPADAVPAVVDVSTLSLDHAERLSWVTACGKIARQVADGRLVAPLGQMLAPGEPEVRWGAIEALLKIDTDAAAKALQPHLAEEAELDKKLQIAGFLGRHGIRDGYPYAIEHLSEPYLREQAISALASIRDPRAIGELRNILQTSNDVAWNSAAVRAFGRLGVDDLASRFLEVARGPKNPLAPSALIALGDLHEPQALAIVRAGLASRSNELLTAAARAAGQLAALRGLTADDVTADEVRGQMADLLADPSAPLEARDAAFDSLVMLNDPRLDAALALAARDAGLEGSELLNKIEKLLRERKTKLNLQ